MTELIRSWIIGLTAVAFLAGIAMAITPRGRVRMVVGFACGLVTIVALLAPILEFDDVAYARHTRQQSFDWQFRLDDLEVSQERLVEHIISEQTATYIWDKATQTGITNLDITVDLARTENGELYPYAVYLNGAFTAQQRTDLTKHISETFGISAENQHWSQQNG